MADRIQLRRDTAADWTSNDPTLSQGEPGVETDTGLFKFGDGSTAWTSLDYANWGPGAAAAVTKLAGIEALADVTDAANVAAAGALMDSDLLDEDDMASDSATAPPSQQSTKAYVDTHRAKVAASGYWVSGYFTTVSAPPTQSQMRLWPVVIPRSMTIQEFTFHMITAETSATNYRFGFYNLGSNGDPTTLIGECGSVAAPGVGEHSITGLSITLPAGRVAMAYVPQGAAANGAFYARAVEPTSSASDIGGLGGGWYQSGVTGALPGSATPLTTTAGLHPAFGLRRSAS